MIRRLKDEEQRVVLRAHGPLKKAREWVEEAEKTLRDSFAKAVENEVLEASFTPSGDSGVAAFQTTFGKGRAISVNAIIDDKAVIRYIFEKEATNESGDTFHTPVGEIHFDQNGLITAADGTKLANLNSLDGRESYKAIAEIGLALIHACAVDRHYLL